MGKEKYFIIPVLIGILILAAGCYGTTTTPPVSKNEQGQRLIKAGNYDQAIDIFNSILTTSPNDASTLANRGIAYYYKGNFVQAISDLTFAIEFNPRLSSAYYYRGLAYSTDGGFSLAIADFTKMIELEPTNSTAYFLRANMYSQWNKPELGIPDLQKVVELNNNADLVQQAQSMLKGLGQ